MRNLRGIVMVGLLMASIVSLAACGSLGSNAADRDTVSVDKVTAHAGRLAGGTVVGGKLDALNSANVVPKSAGKVSSIPVDVGSEVNEGDLLVSLDAADLGALVDLYAAQLDKARNSDLPTQKNQAELALANAESTFKTAEADYQRSKQLRDSAVISAQQFEQSEKTYVQAKASYESAQNSLDILNSATIPETIRQSEAQLKKAQADFANTIIKAPISGVVTARNINPGEMASTAQPVITLVNLDTVVVSVNVNEAQINKVNVGQQIKVKVSSVQDEPFTGVVTNVAFAANSTSKAYPVKIQIPNPQHVLKPGMFAEIFLNTGDEDGIIIPREALATGEEKSFVWVINNGIATRCEVVAGLSDGKNVVIRSGLREGEEIVITNIDSLKEGIKVIAQN
ncbi:MAG: Toluene efflux pump periplasmic linker protein TtgD precursor [Pelotomaculum sp. PtaB.Bin104]|uniref:Efflux RND transporter periplasmic adaptor subunit n=1 Tax=Pelotomaculum isophthalicicum JI TaxID=947010 RepID=A0A9X4JWR8_9FIRM|nr:efflux RND transporter periplasmic adaptor subunit [Pelotomaculum isophthalicicum]MDF9410032.1 efflux RND transporter periplasmic adaptor subunit [Pelotomaculum isophthalicicum JI]OPX92231.1 MAG: Toluene efflux pump periplasmic linker protein TtgD precursor [Pelotomaculum sp. PtaB.Bin104]